MRQFTATEKQQLQARIEDQRHWRHGLKKSESLLGKYAYLGKYLFLGAIFCLLAFNVVLLLKHRYLTVERFSGLGVSLILIFGHLADDFAKPGWKRRLLKTACWISVFLTFACLSHRYWGPYTAKLMGTVP